MENKIKILHIAKVLAGVGTSIQMIAENIDEEKFELVLIRDIEENAKPLVYKSGRPIKTYQLNLQREIKPTIDLLFFQKSIQIVKIEKPNLIHCHSAKGGILGRTIGNFTKIPTFFTPQAFSFLSVEDSFKRSFFRRIEQVYSKTNSYLIACSDSEASRAIKEVKYPKNKVYVVDNFLPSPSKEPDFNFESTYICSIGRPSYQKNTLYLLQVFKEINRKLPHLNLYILGVGHYSPDLQVVKQYIQDNNLTGSVKLFEWTSREETLDILNKSLFYLSFARYEGLSFAVLEAMALGKPCVLSNVDGNKDCIKDGNGGLLIDLNTPPAKAADKISTILASKSKLQEVGRSSYIRFLENFTAEKNIPMLESLYAKHAKKNSFYS